uniref:Uncharacterized protein n=1 Tax=Brassica campestris TaxID=3711 RepID=M4C7J8_BRACM
MYSWFVVCVDRICGFVPFDSPLCDLFRSELIAFSFGSEFVCDSCSAFLSSWILLQLHSLLVDQRICFFKAIHQHLISSLTSASPFDSMASAYPPTLVQTCSLAKSFLSAFLCEATSKIKCEFSNGSLCRPPESYFTYCSWCSFSELVSVWLTHSVSRHLGSGTVYWCVAYKLQKVSEDKFKHQHLCRQGEKRLACEVDVLVLMIYRGLQVIAPLAHGSFITFYAIEAAALVQHLSSSFRLMSLDQHAYATIDFWLKYITMVVGFKTSSTLYVTLLFSVAESLILLCGSHIWRDVVCADVVYFLGTRHELQELDRLLQKMEIMSETSYFLLSGGLMSAASRYHKLIKLLITLQMQRSSTGLVLKQLKHYMLASPVLHLSAASGFLHFLKTDSRFVSAYWLSMQQDVVCRRPDEAEYTSLAIASWEWDWFSYLLLSVVLFSGSQAALILHDLQWQQSFPSLSLQGLNRAFASTDHINVAGSGWFKFILDLLYCSLPRPPEIPLFTWFSSPRCKFLTS